MVKLVSDYFSGNSRLVFGQFSEKSTENLGGMILDEFHEMDFWTAQKSISELLGTSDINWKDVYQLPHRVRNETSLSVFQY